MPYQPFWKIAKMGLFYLCMKIKKKLGQMPLFEVLWKCHSVTLSKICLSLRPSAYPSGWKWIDEIISKIPRRNQKNIFVYGFYESLERLNWKAKLHRGPISLGPSSIDFNNFIILISGHQGKTLKVPMAPPRNLNILMTTV